MSNPVPVRKPAYLRWFIGAGLCYVLPILLLTAGLTVGSLTLVYASILLSLLFFPVLAVAMVQLVRAQA